jgi:hypothetical protein
VTLQFCKTDLQPWAFPQAAYGSKVTSPNINNED